MPVKRRRYEQCKAFTSILVNSELSDKNKARCKQDKESVGFSTGDLLLVNEREKPTLDAVLRSIFFVFYSTVTLLARFLGLSTSTPRATLI